MGNYFFPLYMCCFSFFLIVRGDEGKEFHLDPSRVYSQQESVKMIYAVYLLVAAYLTNARVLKELLPRACTGDNCNRAITGNLEGPLTLVVHPADCGSYFLATVYLSPT
jgi:hypothetical protein